MVVTEIMSMLKEAIGLHSGSVGVSSIERAIKHRMTALGIAKEAEYHSHITKDQQELAELIEEVVVPETWFFRNLVPFEALVKYLPVLVHNNPDKSLRLLSLPCSTGEEPYSIAIALLESAYGNMDFVVDSIDISQKALRKAEKGVFGEYSFREKDGVEELKAKYFQKQGRSYCVKQEVRAHVHFMQGNILAEDCFKKLSPYDVIFCRNLLIYFDRATQKSVLEKLDKILKPHGLLVVGHAEAAQAVGEIFSRVDIPRAFAYQKKAACPLTVVAERKNDTVKKLELAYQQLLAATPKAAKPAQHSQAKTKPKKSQKKPKRPAPDKEQQGEISAIQDSISLGRLVEAASQCETLLNREPGSADAYYLLGLISHLEQSNNAAETFLRKAIYLDPNHGDALKLSALLAENKGDVEAATALLRRRQRVLKRNSAKNPPRNENGSGDG
jgi:chemotaxis protein methyltransferase WspC